MKPAIPKLRYGLITISILVCIVLPASAAPPADTPAPPIQSAPPPAASTYLLSAGAAIFIDSGQNLGDRDSVTVALGDLDGDGDLDAFVGQIGTPHEVWVNAGTGTFTDSGQRLGTDLHTNRIALGDLDADGDLDAFAANGYGWDYSDVWFNNGSGLFTDSGQALGPAPSKNVALGDLDGDGDLDAFIGNWSDPNRVYFNDGTGVFSDTQQRLGGAWDSWGLALGDLDADGDLDAFVANTQGSRIWLNAGDGAFTDSGQVLGLQEGNEVALGDLDGDGDLDAFITHGAEYHDQVWLNAGDALFSDSGQTLGTNHSEAVALGDFDADGDLDAFVANSAGFGNTVWLNTGAGIFSSTGYPRGNSDTYGVALGDVDRDGDLDAFTANWSNQPNKVWLNSNDLPDTPSDPLPADGAVRVPRNPRLTWTGGDPDGDPVLYTVYGRKAGAAISDVWCAASLNLSCRPDFILAEYTKYIWYVSADDQNGGQADGPTWEFTTRAGPVLGNITFLPVILAPDVSIPVASVLTPFDANVSDLVGPGSWATNYGKTAELIVASDGVELDVLAQDYDPGTAWDAVLLHIKPRPNGGGYYVTQALTDLPILDQVMGLAIDGSGNRYYATGVDESHLVDPYYPPLDTYRSDIVRVIKLDLWGDVLFNIDLDLARYAFDNNAEMIINPTVAATSRLAVVGNEIALVHGNNTDPDWNIGGARHQKALSTRLDASTGIVTRISSVWVSHSFDQRLFCDGAGIIEYHLGDAFPRYLVFGREHISYPLFHIKGPVGENLTATRLGNIALIENDPLYGYLALFSTETSSIVGTMYGERINGPRDLAIVRVNRSDNSVDPNLPDTLTVTSAGVEVTNRLKWLTNYSSASNLHAERPKLIAIGGDRYIVLWEQWLTTGEYSDTFNGVYGMLIDAKGDILHPATLITAAHHLPRGDDAFFLDGRAAWMTGNASERELYIHFVDEYLYYEMEIVE